MSNDEYITSLENYNRLFFDQSRTNTIYCNSNNKYNLYPTVFPAKTSDIHSILPTAATPLFKKIAYQTDDVSGNKDKNYRRNNNNPVKSGINSQIAPMNLITNKGLDLSHSIRKLTYASYFNNDLLSHSINSSSPSSSASPSIDVENDVNDDSCDRIMSPVSIPSHHQKPLFNDTHNPNQSSFPNMELTAASMPSGFPLNYRQFYANNAALYGSPVMFSGAIHAAHASYMAGLPLHAALSPNESYLKAIQASACGIYSPTALVPPPPPPPTNTSVSVNPPLITSKLSSLRGPTVASMMAPAPSSHSVGICKTPPQQLQQYSSTILNSVKETEQQPRQQNKRDCLGTSLNSQTTLRPSGNSHKNAGTYLNEKVNDRLSGVDATKDSHFKVPNGKEGSLKHRILRLPSNGDGSSEQNKTPVMRAYSTVSNFKKGNYIELANGGLRRVEDMRTEDFIQCAERSPHHQLAESTVVKINTNLPTTAVITFSYDKNRLKVDMEVSYEHPFFVYGQGWASCNPEISMKMFGLKCQRLQVGDICISLTKREHSKQQTAPATNPTPNSSLPQLNEVASYQTRHSIVSSPNVAHLKSPSLSTICSTTEVPYSVTLNNHSFSIPVPQSNHHMQQQQHHHPVQQQAYAEMAKLMSSYAYTKGLPQLSHEQLKDVVMDAAIAENLPTKMMSVFYQNQIFQMAQQQHQEHQRYTELKNNQQRISNSNYNITTSINSRPSPGPTDLEINHIQQPPQTQPLDITMSRKRRWSAPENMFDDEPDTQPPCKKSSPTTTART